MAVRIAAALGLLAYALSGAAWAINGQQPLGLTTMNGWRSLELFTQGDNVLGVADPGFGATAPRGNYDGIGLHPGPEGLSVWFNHENSDAAISRLDLDAAALRSQIDSVLSGGAPIAATTVVGVGYAYERIFDSAYHAQTNPAPVASGVGGVAAYGDANFARFCSGTSHHANAFGAGRGFVDSIYLTGEEVGGGSFYALDEATRTLWQVEDLGLGSWENAAAVDTGEADHVALVLSSDVGGSPGDYLRLYVGEKGIDANADGEVDFLERNGLRGGSIYYFKPSSGSTSDLPDGVVSGAWSASTTGALRETKLEDIHTNPRDGTQLVLGAQNDGVYHLSVGLSFAAGAFAPNDSAVVITQIDDDDDAPIGSPDNVTWTYSNEVFVEEDGDGDGVFRIDPSGGSRVQVAVAGSEPSGIVDASIELGYRPGSVLITSLQGNGGVGAQLGFLIAPDAAPLLAGDYDLDGDVDPDDSAVWQAAYGSTGFSLADGTRDGRVDAADYTVWRDAFEGNAASVPEPSAAVVAIAGVAVVSRRSRRRNGYKGSTAGIGPGLRPITPGVSWRSA